MSDTGQTMESEIKNTQEQIAQQEKEIRQFKKDNPGKPVPGFYIRNLGWLEKQLEDLFDNAH